MAKIPECREENLECGETLLAIDDTAALDFAGLGLLLVDNHCPEEVNRSVFPAVDELGKLTGNIFPKWFPLMFPSPNVLSLKGGNL
ncbi:protein of unknown function [Burkholderia multivorans]